MTGRSMLGLVACLAMVLGGCNDEKATKRAARLQALESEFQDLQQRNAAFKSRLGVVEAKLVNALRGTSRTIPLNQTGNEVCNAHREICMGVNPSRTVDALNRDWGHMVLSCNSRVRKGYCGIFSGVARVYFIDRGSFERLPDSKVPGVPANTGTLCLGESSYEAALCSTSEK